MRALNFYSSVYQANLVIRRKNCTIRLGDKTAKYREGDVILVTFGNRYQPRELLFRAVIDRVTVKEIADLSADELRAENPELDDTAGLARFLERIYDRDVSERETVSVIHFSEIRA